jgi:hypothetical protein
MSARTMLVALALLCISLTWFGSAMREASDKGAHCICNYNDKAKHSNIRTR